MSDTVTFRIGGQDVILGPLTIWSLRKCWPDIEALAVLPPTALDRFQTLVSIISASWRLKDETKTPEAIERILGWEEARDLETGVVKLLHISGFKPEPTTPQTGEAVAAIPET